MAGWQRESNHVLFHSPFESRASARAAARCRDPRGTVALLREMPSRIAGNKLMFSSTEASTFQWESSVFVSPTKAPALMILDEYEAVHGESLSWGKIRCFSGLIACQDARCRHPFR
jgi:hypothetical protein